MAAPKLPNGGKVFEPAKDLAGWFCPGCNNRRLLLGDNACLQCGAAFDPIVGAVGQSPIGTLSGNKNAPPSRSQIDDKYRAELESLIASGSLLSARSLETELITCSNGHVYALKDFRVTTQQISTEVKHFQQVNAAGAYSINAGDLLGGKFKSGNLSGAAFTTSHSVPVVKSSEEVSFGCPTCKSSVFHFQRADLGDVKVCEKQHGASFLGVPQLQDFQKRYGGFRSTDGLCPLCNLIEKYQADIASIQPSYYPPPPSRANGCLALFGCLVPFGTFIVFFALIFCGVGCASHDSPTPTMAPRPSLSSVPVYSNAPTSLVECPMCYGSGKVAIMDFDKNGPVEKWYECPLCRGTGRVTAAVAEQARNAPRDQPKTDNLFGGPDPDQSSNLAMPQPNQSPSQNSTGGYDPDQPRYLNSTGSP